MDSNNSDIIYLGCYGNECAVYKTIDAGETWKPKPLPPSPTNPVVNDIAISGDTILAGCAGGTVQEGIWLSDSGGDNSGASMIEFTITWRNMHL